MATGNRTEWTQSFRGEVPACERCGELMVEGGGWDKENDCPIYTWFCMQDDCRNEDGRLFGQQIKAKKAASLKENTEKMFPQFGVPKKYYDYRLTNYRGHDELIKKCWKYLKKPDKSIFIHGNTGTGKTHIAVAILRELIVRGEKDMIFKSMPELMNELRWSFRDDTEMSEKDLILRYSHIGSLVLDDFGSERTTEYSYDTIYSIIDFRVREMKPTIVTSNLSPQEIEKNIGARIASRLQEFKNWHFETMEDYRKK